MSESRSGAPADLSRVRFLTMRYGDLQGLHAVAAHGWLALWLTTAAAFDVRLFAHNERTSVVAVAALILPVGLGFTIVRRYYEDHFGRLSDRGGPHWDQAMAYLAGATAAYLARPTHSDVAIVYAGFAALHAYIAVRDHPYRTHHVLGFTGCTLAAASLGWSGPVHTVYAAIALAHGSMALTGLLDHRLLISTLGGVRTREI